MGTWPGREAARSQTGDLAPDEEVHSWENPMTQENKELTQIKEISKTEGKGTKHGKNKNSDS